MTEKKLYEQLMYYKRKHGVTKEIQQHYLWALETVLKNNSSQESQQTS